jgi:glutamate racemase
MGPIGVFDSGYGGLTVLSQIKKALPEYDFLYLGDNARAPYGNRSFDVVHEFTWQAVQFLFEQDCPLVILACNTASAKALRTIQQTQLLESYPSRRVLGVIRPSTETIGDWTKTNHVGILGTHGTIQSNSYQIELQKFAPHVKVFQLACPMWVPLIENNYHNTLAGKTIIRDDVYNLLAMSPQIDTIVLACTHYPLIEAQIRELVGPSVNVFSQGEIVANKLAVYLSKHPEITSRLSKKGQTRLFTTENEYVFNENATNFLGEPISALHVHL